MIAANIKKAVTDAISTENKATRKWQDAGIACRAEYANREALEAVRAAFLDEVIYPALGDDAVRIMTAEVPRKGSKDYNSSSPTQQAAFAELQKAKVTVRGKGSVYFGRVLEYAYPVEADSEPRVKRTLRTRTDEDIQGVIKAHENNEHEGDAQLILDLRTALTAYHKRAK